MNVHIRLFAGLHDLVGQRELTLELNEGATVIELQEELGRQYPAVIPFLPTLVCAIGDEFVPTEQALRDGDDISLIPPVSGGSEADSFLITTDPLAPDSLVATVRQDESGAVALFYGVARNNSEGRRVQALEYEAHDSLAEKKLRQVGQEVRDRWPVTGVGIFHRTGRLAIGETSLLVAVSAAHRREAFEACHFAVDRIKEIVPIWKKEIWEDGGGEWASGHPVSPPEPAQVNRRS